MRSTRPANDGVGLQQNVARGQIRFLHSLQHRYHGHRADIGAILVLGGQRHWQEARVLHVIDADDAHLVGHMYTVTHQACHDSCCGKVIGTDYRVWSAIFQHPLDEVRIVRVATAYKVLLKGNSVRKQSFTIAGNSCQNSRGRQRLRYKGDTLHSMKKQMLRDEEARSPIVNSDEVVLRPHGIWRTAPVEQYNLNARTIQRGYDSFIDGVLFRCVLQRGEEDSRNFLSDISMAKLLGLLLLLRRLAHGVSPQQGVRLG